EHAEKLGAELVVSEAIDVGKKGENFVVKTKDKEHEGKAVILATGSKKRKLGLPKEEEMTGKGVAYCATCDAMFFNDKIVGVTGGGNSAVKSALLLAEYAKKVYLVYRREKKDMRAMPYWVKKAEENDKIEMIFRSVPKEIKGKEKLESVVFEKDGKDLEIKMDGLFVEIGTDPENSLAKKLGVSLDEQGKIKVEKDMSTNVEGVFAAGDITNGSNGMEQIVTSCAEGSIAAESAYNYVKK
ncbi:MAG: FAD-dependent oxidoreductase, partial [Candidatus Aenigmarchaeota archaeon]|nr:FAD-dependent oxidoreductase [Candidatus Aenigmarchaeota archaeon]